MEGQEVEVPVELIQAINKARGPGLVIPGLERVELIPAVKEARVHLADLLAVAPVKPLIPILSLSPAFSKTSHEVMSS